MNCETCKATVGNMFYCALNDSGNTVVYCYECYSKIFLDNMEEELKGICECGTKAKMGQNHSYWCELYKKELA